MAPRHQLCLCLLMFSGCTDEPADTGSGCTPATEIPYDGLDQDCDGADLTDVDSDGSDATEAGGSDCDDDDPNVNPAAAELCNGADDDCDGLVDVEDDDLMEALTWSALEDKEDGVDNDCDGWVDECEVCQDGSGHHATIQGCVDDGEALVVICPGSYPEQVRITEGSVTLQGGGEHPGDVIIDSSTLGTSAVHTNNCELDLRLVDLTLVTDGKAGLHPGRVGDLSIHRVDFCKTEGVSFGNGMGERFTLRYSRFCGGSLVLSSTVDLEIAYSVFGETSIDYGYGSDCSESDDIDMVVQNNLFHGGQDQPIVAWQDDGLALRVHNNTFTGIQAAGGLSIGCPHTYGHGLRDTCPEVDVSNNIFDHKDISDPYGLWTVLWYGSDSVTSFDPADAAPASWASNLVWGLTGHYAYVWYRSAQDYWDWEPVDTVHDWSLSEGLSAASIEADPLFSWDSSTGSFTPDPTYSTLGAFGWAADGDWADYPWALP